MSNVDILVVETLPVDAVAVDTLDVHISIVDSQEGAMTHHVQGAKYLTWQVDLYPKQAPGDTDSDTDLDLWGES